MPTDAEKAVWGALHDRTTAAAQKMRELEHPVRVKFMACANGSGPGPTVEELERLDELRRIYDAARSAEAAFLKDLFKVNG